jgi:hypothetical protein
MVQTANAELLASEEDATDDYILPIMSVAHMSSLMGCTSMQLCHICFVKNMFLRCIDCLMLLELINSAHASRQA